MARSGGTYTAPSNSWNPAVIDTTLDPDDWNATREDMQDAITETVYTAGLSINDGRPVTTDGTDTKKIQRTGTVVSDTDGWTNVSQLGLVGVTVANLPAGAEGQVAYATNGRKNGEGGGAGTGVIVFFDGSDWCAIDTGAPVAA